jgi:hypothetical protein
VHGIIANHSSRLTRSLLLLAVIYLGGCAGGKESETARQAVVDYDLILDLPEEPISFDDQVKPVLDNRCVVCHGCFDAQCQLKLTSYEGVTRGANKAKVYDSARVKPVEPTRLFIDATSTQEWRDKDFFTVLNEGEKDPESNLKNSVLYQMLRLKQLNPQARLGMLPDSFDLSLDREQVCTTLDEFSDYSKDHPLWGMPYAMPNLGTAEYDVLVQWLAQGSPAPAQHEPSEAARPKIETWERFLNGPSNKERLMSRYIYEHLFLGHIHLDGTDSREFYRLVRSTTPAGQPIDEIPSVRPFDDPGTGNFYYRLRLYEPTIVAKSHVLYQLTDEKIQRYRELFLVPDYEVSELPNYILKSSSNPFLTFQAIPPKSRYRFLLDDAKFFIEGFIKGPVCRGQVALNVIEDQFWVMFFNPEEELYTDTPEFLDGVIDYLDLPTERGDTLNLLAIWTDYWGRQKKYLAAKEEFSDHIEPMDINAAMKYIWNGNGKNPNAALSIFRHEDSATVIQGFVGNYPETAWIIDYPLFERIHYLLVAGFDVYGNVGHQLNTRLYMDFLRMEGEDNFLSLLPPEQRKVIRDEWYMGNREKRMKLFAEPIEWLDAYPVKGYKTADTQLELYEHLVTRMGKIAGPVDFLNRCDGIQCVGSASTQNERDVDLSMKRLTQIHGQKLTPFPDVAFVRIKDMNDEGLELTYSLVLNKGYKNVTSIFAGDDRRDRDSDTLSVVKGIVGAYPNFFFVVSSHRVDEFVDMASAIEGRDDYERFVARFGVRRTNPKFWALSDWFNDTYAVAKPLDSGIFDLNRYRNR